MTRIQQTAVSAGALILGTAMLTRGLRTSRRLDFRGRTVVITGGSRGLGLLIARELAAEGARLVLAARNKDELDRARQDLESRGATDIMTVVCDVGVRADAEQLINHVAQRFGAIDVLINNAGVMKVGPIEHMTHADFEEAMAVRRIHQSRLRQPARRRC